MTTNPLDSGPLAVLETVAYQPGGIVSRQLLKTAGGGVTAFAFDAGQGLSEHSSPQQALIQVIEGEAEVEIDGRAQVLRAGEMILLPAARPHAVTARQRFKMLLTMLRG